MILSWQPVVWIDILGSLAVVILSLTALLKAWKWTRKKTTDTFRHYVFLITTAFVVFALSRSCGHLLKQILLHADRKALWLKVAPFSGAINTATFITVFALGIYFHRSRRIHAELEEHRTRLRDLVRRRTEQLREKTLFLENIIASLQHPFYVIDAETHAIVLANPAANFDYALGSTCYQLTHGRDTPCSGKEHPCPIREVAETGEPCRVEHIHRVNGEERIFEVHAYPIMEGNRLIRVIEYVLDISERKRMEEERERYLRELEQALEEVQTLRGLLPICSFCKKVRDEKGYWNQIEAYLSSRSELLFSHGICEECLKKHYPDCEDLVE
ncbi:MAG: hypothetical protein Kow0089_24360 [Desulfobulbaceae bacterium]